MPKIDTPLLITDCIDILSMAKLQFPKSWTWHLNQLPVRSIDNALLVFHCKKCNFQSSLSIICPRHIIIGNCNYYWQLLLANAAVVATSQLQGFAMCPSKSQEIKKTCFLFHIFSLDVFLLDLEACGRQCHRLTVIMGFVRRSPQPSESVCRKCTACKKHLLVHQSSWK